MYNNYLTFMFKKDRSTCPQMFLSVAHGSGIPALAILMSFRWCLGKYAHSLCNPHPPLFHFFYFLLESGGGDNYWNLFLFSVFCFVLFCFCNDFFQTDKWSHFRGKRPERMEEQKSGLQCVVHRSSWKIQREQNEVQSCA